MKKTIIILVIVGLAGLGAFRAAQVISAKKEDPKRGASSQIPLVDVGARHPGADRGKDHSAPAISPRSPR